MKNSEELFDINQLESNSQAGQDLFVVAMTQSKKNGIFLEIGANHCKTDNNTYLLEKSLDWSGYSVDIEDLHTPTSSVYDANVKKHWRMFYNDVKDSTWPDNPRSVYDLPFWIQKEILIDRRYHDYFTDFIKRFLLNNLQYKWSIDRPLTEFIEHDALTLDYSFLPEKIDYLQIDIDPPMANLKVLEMLLETPTRFAVITFEHDLWQGTEEVRYVRTRSRELLKNAGYDLVVNDLTIQPGVAGPLDQAPLYFEDWYAHPSEISLTLRDRYRSVTDHLYPKYFTEILDKRLFNDL